MDLNIDWKIHMIHFRKNISRIQCFFQMFIFVVTCNSVSHAASESGATMLSLLISPSTRVSGMGQAGVALTDEASSYYNPAAPAFIAKSHYLSITNYLSDMQWMPLLTDDIHYSYHDVQIGFHKKIIKTDKSERNMKIPLSISGAISYYKTSLDSQYEYVTADESGNLVGYYDVDTYEKTENVSLSAAMHSIVDFGIGITCKKLKNTYNEYSYSGNTSIITGKENAYDFGVLFNLPLISALEIIKENKIFTGNVVPFINISAGASWNNRGDMMRYSGMSVVDPLPANRKAGIAVTGGFQSIHPHFKYFTYTFAYERYTPQIRGVESKPSHSDNKRGAELYFFETVGLRYGKFVDNDGGQQPATFGTEIRSDGLTKALCYFLDIKQEDSEFITFVSEHLSISWTHYFYEDHGSAIDEINHSQLSIKF